MTTTDLTATPNLATLATATWEPFVVEGQVAGQVSWLVQQARPNGPLAAGFWRITPEEGAEIPYAVNGSETFHVLEGEAVLEEADGRQVRLSPGTVVSFPDGYTATWRTLTPFTKFFVVA